MRDIKNNQKLTLDVHHIHNYRIDIIIEKSSTQMTLHVNGYNNFKQPC